MRSATLARSELGTGGPPPGNVVIMGAFPPPMGGAAKNNELLYRSLLDAGVNVTKIDLLGGGHAHNRTLKYHLRRIGRNLRGLCQARLAGRTGGTLYMVPDGGLGAWYTLAHIRVAGSVFERLVLHHRTFRYIDRWSKPVALLTRAYPEKTMHVFLSAGMAKAYQNQYGPVGHMIACNARFVAEEADELPAPRREGPLRLGHLSNLCRDKGFFNVASAYEAARAAGIDAELWLAGPVIAAEVAERIKELSDRYGRAVKHVGPISGAVKRDWYRSIDLFLFPTQFDQEASPNVVYEALSAGVPVLATPRACIPEMILGEGGAVCPPEVDFSSFVLDYLQSFSVGTGCNAARAKAIKADLRVICTRSRSEYASLMRILGSVREVSIRQEF